MGSADPQYTDDGTLLHTFIWDSEGNCIQSFGNGGDEMLAGTPSLFIYFKGIETLHYSQFSTADEQYAFNSTELTDKLIDMYNNGQREFCVFVGVEEGLVLDYTYDTILTGTK